MCAEGYLWELERRGYLSSGPFTPEVVLDQPERVTGLHEEFVHAGSDVVEAFTVIVTIPFIIVNITDRRYNHHHLHHYNRCCFQYSVYFKMVSKRSEKPIYAPPRPSGVSATLSLPVLAQQQQ